MLLVTHPTPDTARAFVLLVQAGLLDVPGLRVLGIYHSADTLDADATAAYLSEAGASGWFTLTAVDCELGADPFVPTQACAQAFSALFDAADGVILTGGPDLPAADYGEAQSLLTEPRSFERTKFELAFVATLLGGRGWSGLVPALLAARPDFLVFGICLGMQELNVALGGTLHQDIPAEVYGLATYEEVLAEPRAAHRRYRLSRDTGTLGRFVRHKLKATPQWTAKGLPDIETGSQRVMSAHHQAVESLGQDLVVLATSRDRAIVEAVGHARYPAVLGVQFHPEHEAFSRAARGEDQGSLDAASLELHRQLWRWIGQALSSSARLRTPGSPTPAR